MLSRDVFGTFQEAAICRRNEDGFSRSELGNRMDKEKTGVSKLLKEPGNWTLRTMSDFANAMDMEVRVVLIDRRVFGRTFDRTGAHVTSAAPMASDNHVIVTATNSLFPAQNPMCQNFNIARISKESDTYTSVLTG
jgi:hypothetical protein